jgi:predicted nuclease with RNAse H fold
MTQEASQKAVRITDTSLRDGSHAMSHQFTNEQVRDVARALDEGGVPVIERSPTETGLRALPSNTASQRHQRWN